MNIPKIRADFERLYGRPLTLSDAAIRRLVERAAELVPPKLALPAPPVEPEPSEAPTALPTAEQLDRSDLAAPRVRWSNEVLDQARAEERFSESDRRRILAMHGGGPVHVSTGQLSELDPGAHLVSSPDGAPTYGRHEPEGSR